MILSLTLVCLLGAPSQELPPRSQEAFLFRMFEVRDLAERVGPDFPAPRIGVPRPSRPLVEDTKVPLLGDIPIVGSVFTKPALDSKEVDAEARVAAGARVLEEALSHWITPKSNDPMFSVRATKAGTIVMNGTLAQVEWAEQFFVELGRRSDMIDLQARFTHVPSARLKELGLEGTSAFPRPEDVPALLEALQQTPGAEMVSAPRVLLMPLQRASISVLETLKFVQDWRVETVAPNAQEVLVADVAELDTGLALDARCVPLPGGRIGLTLEAQEARLAKPLVAFQKKLTTKKGTTEMPLSIPEVSVQRVQTELVLQDGSTAVLVVEDPSGTKEQRLVVIVTARYVAPK